MFTFIKKIALVALATALTSSSAYCYTILPNSTSSLGTSGWYIKLDGKSGEFNGRRFRVNFDTTNGSASIGNNTNGLLDSVTLTSLLNSASIVEEINGKDFAVSGSLSGNLRLGYNNVSFNQAANQATGIGGIASNNNSNVQFNGTIDGKSVNFSATLMPAFMDFTVGQFDGLYDRAVNSFTNQNKLNLALDINGQAGTIHAWVKGDALATVNGIGNNSFSFTADLHNSVNTAVPEPTTVGLMVTGLIGGVLRRKRKV